MGNKGTSCNDAVEDFIGGRMGKLLTPGDLAAAAEDAFSSEKSQREFINKSLRIWSGEPGEVRKAARSARGRESLASYCEAVFTRLHIRGAIRGPSDAPLAERG